MYCFYTVVLVSFRVAGRWICHLWTEADSLFAVLMLNNWLHIYHTDMRVLSISSSNSPRNQISTFLRMSNYSFKYFFPAVSSSSTSFVHCTVRIVTPVHSKTKLVYALLFCHLCSDMLGFSVQYGFGTQLKCFTFTKSHYKETVTLKKLCCRSMEY